MAGNVSDDAFARAANQMGAATVEHIEAARAVQAEAARKGAALSLAEVMVRQGIITALMRESIEKKLEAQQAGGIKQLGPYKLLRKLGEGGMGAVYLADDTSVGRKVAVKVLPRKYADDREFLTRFRREAQATGKLNHVNIVTAYNIGEELGVHYYAMEYCEGETLDRVLKREKFIPWDAAAGVVLQVARGLRHAHEHGIIHRDIKPANIFVCKPLRREGEVEGGIFTEGFVAKILDLGLSKNIGGTEQSFYTQTGVALGTPHYLSPEQAKGEKSIDGRTDIYSLGATFYHLVTGHTPFEGSTAAIIMMKHLNEQLPNPQDLNADIPDGVVHVIQKTMAKEPADRYANCQELLNDLELVIDGKMPSSQAIDAVKSSVGMAKAVPSRDRKGAERRPLAPARASEAPARGTRQHEPVAMTRELPELVPVEAAPSRKNLYIGAAAGLGLLVLLFALLRGGGSPSRDREGAEQKPLADARGSETKKATTGTGTDGKRPPSEPVAPTTTGHAAKEGQGEPEKGVTEAWIKWVQGLPVEQQVEEVVKKLREMNPGYDGKHQSKVENGKATEISLYPGYDVTDVSPASALIHLQAFACTGDGIKHSRLTNIAPLHGLSLSRLVLRCSTVKDLSPLRGMALRELSCDYTGVGDLSPIAGMPLMTLRLEHSQANDLSPLKGMPLNVLSLNATPVSDLSPLRGMPLGFLDCARTRVGDLSALKDMPKLKEVTCDFVPERDAAVLRSIKTLERINDLPVTEFWRKYPDAGAATVGAGADENPFKRAKVGDWAEYSQQRATAAGPAGDDARIRRTVTKKSDAAVTIEVASQGQKKGEVQIDLTWKGLYSPVPGMIFLGQHSVKLGSGTEVLNVAGRRLETTWIQSETKIKDQTFTSKQWFSPDVPVGGLVKGETTVGGNRFIYELKDFGFGEGGAAAAGGNVDDPARWAKAINLLALVDARQDTASGKWEVKDGGLVVTPGDDAKLRLPYKPPEEYDFRITFTRETGDECVMQCLRAAGHSFRWRMGGWRNTIFGFGVIGNQDAEANASGVKAPQCLRNGTRHTSVVRVRKDGVEGWLDGKLITKWKTNYQDMGLLPNWTLGEDTVLGLACQFSRTVFHSVEALEVTGKGTATRAAAAEVAVDDPARWRNAVDLLALVDQQKDVAAGQWTRQAAGWRPNTTNRGILEFPYRPPEEYDFKVVFSRDEGLLDIGQVLSKGGRSFKWQMWHGPDETRCGFEMVKGVPALDGANPTVRKVKPAIENGRRYASIVQVRNDGLKAYLDGKLVSEWKTDYSDLSIFQNARLRDETLLGLTTMSAKGTIHEAQALEVTDKGTFTRPNDAAAQEAEKKRTAAQPEARTPTPDTRATKAQQLFSVVLRETAPLLAQSRFGDALALLEGKAKDPVLADAAELLKQEKADVEAVLELRRAAVGALGHKMAGKTVTLKKGAATITGKVKGGAGPPAVRGPGPKGPAVALEVVGGELQVRAEELHPDDVDQYAPKPAAGDARATAEDLRKRGLLYLYAGDADKAREYFTKARDAGLGEGATPYLERAAALDVGDREAAAESVWNKAEAFFDAKRMEEAKTAYDAFQRSYLDTATAAKRAATLKQRYAALEKALGPPKEMTLDLGGGVTVELVLMPAGTFTMGCPDNEPGLFPERGEGPQHEVTITKPFYMGKYEVTVAQFRRFAESAKFQTECEQGGNKGVCMDNARWKELTGVNWMKPNYPQDDSYPVCLLTWNDAQAFVSWASKATGKTVRLPTEAEWEYACRAQTATRFYTGPDDADLDKAGWHKGNSGWKPHPVGQKAPNAWGLYDMHGNVWEWCQDWNNNAYYRQSPRTDPPGPATGGNRLTRGGCFHGETRHCRSGQRGSIGPDLRITANGFRLVVEAGATVTAQPEAALPKEVPLDLGGGAKMELVLVPAGEFMMGSDEPEAAPIEKPAHKVKISRPYYIGKHEVTVAQFARFAGTTGYQTDCEKAGDRGTSAVPTYGEKAGINWRKSGYGQGPDHPVVLVSWNDAEAFCQWATANHRGTEAQRKWTVRLPTEAEWEYASRGPQGRRYPWGDVWDGTRANHGDVSFKKASQTQGATTNDNDGFAYTAPVGSYKLDASWCGAHDLAGNVTELCADWFSATYYAQSPAADPKGPATGAKRVARPGCWFDGTPATACRSARRLGHTAPDARHTGVGFRVVVEAPAKTP